MIQFPVDFKVTKRYSEFQLNDDWTVECQLHLDESLERSYEKNVHVRCFIKTCGDIIYELPILISGKLSFGKLDGPVLKTSEFSKFLKRSNLSMRLVELICPKESFKSSFFEDFYLRGLIIISTSDNCIDPNSLVLLSNDLKQLLDPQTNCFADVNLVCGDESIPAHKAILSARSPVFAAMFKNPMKESKENEVFITDIDASVLKILMVFLYTGKVPDLTNTLATCLLVAADKYMMQDLKEECCESLMNNLTPENVLTILVSGGDSLPECLKSVAMDYISNESVDFTLIENAEEWNTLKEGNPALALEVMGCLLKSRDKK